MADVTEYALGIDLGTSGPKVALLSAAGRLVAQATRRIETQFLPEGGAEQDAEKIWSLTVDAIRETVASAGVPAEQIVAIGVDSQYSSIVPVDAEGRPAGPLIVWMDTRGAPHNRAIYKRHSEAFLRWLEVHGIMPLPSGNDCLAHMLHIQEDRPEIYERTAAFVEPMDYLTARFTGRVAANQCTAFMFLLVDNRKLGALEYHPDLVSMSGLDPSRLPELVPLHEPLGPLRADVAEELGLAAGTPVLPALNDTQSGALASGALASSNGGVSIGTTTVLYAGVDRKDTDGENQIVSMPGPLGDRYVVMAENGLGGKTLDHVLRAFVHTKDPLGDHRTDDPFDGLDAAVEQSAPGAGNVLFLPWLNGSAAPAGNGRARGGWLNVSLETTRPDLVRAVLEGVAMNLRWLVDPVEAFARHPLEEISFAGGAAKSAAWAQILADVLDRPVHRLIDPTHMNCRAMALLALYRLGRVGLEQVRCPAREVYKPRPQNREIYDRLFEQFLASYEQNRPVFDALNR